MEQLNWPEAIVLIVLVIVCGYAFIKTFGD
jgi:hypothetical protein